MNSRRLKRSLRTSRPEDLEDRLLTDYLRKRIRASKTAG